MHCLAITVLVIVALIVGHQTLAASIVVVNGKVVKSDGSGVTVTRDGGTTTVTDGLGNVLSQSSNKSAGAGISISPVSGNSNESCAKVPQVSNEPEAQQSLKPTAPVTVPATDIPREELKKAIVQALLQLLLEKAVK